MVKREIRSLRATDWEWGMIKNYASLIKAYTDKKHVMVKGQLGYKTTIFGVPDSVRVGFFYAVPDGEGKYYVEAFYHSEEDAPEDIWEGDITPEDSWNGNGFPEDILIDQAKTPIKGVKEVYGYLEKTEEGWKWTSTKENYLGPDPEKLASKKSVKAAFAYWLTDLLQMQKPVRAKDIIMKK